MLDANLNHRAKKPVTSTFTYSSNGQAAGPLDSPCSSISGGNSAITQQLDYAASVSSLATSSIMDNAESECLEHYESNLEKYKDERDTIQKKTFTKWVNKHLTKSGRQVENLFRDLQNGVNLISLLESLSDETLPRENGLTRFHSIQNVHYCLDFLRKKHIKLVNIRPEDIVDGNGKLTLGLIWTIILNFQVSVINQRRLQQKQQISSRTSTEELVKVTNGNGQTQPLTSSYTSLTKISESHHLVGDGISARDALLQWARRVTQGYQGVHVTNFTNSWKDGLAFNAILHHYRPSAVNWNKISETSVTSRERLSNAFDAFEKEFNISKLLDPEDVDVDNPDEKSVLTYVSSLYNTLAQDEFSKGTADDLLSRLSRGIGITNEKLDHILLRIEDVEASIGSVAASEVERNVRIIVEDLDVLEAPIADYFEDVETLKANRHPHAQDLHRQVFGLHQRRGAYLDRLTNQILVRIGVRVKEVSERYEMTRTNAFQRVEESVRWVRERTEKLNVMQFSETLEVLEEMFERHKLDNRDIQDYRQIVDQCIARQAEVSAEDSYEYCELLQTLESEYQQLRDLSAGRMLDLDSLIAFIRAAQLELVWIHEREEIEVTRNWSDINQLDLPMLQNYFRQLLHEIEIHEKQFNDVHNQGAALINQRHPAGEVIEVYLRTMQSQWDWLLNLSRCLESHLRDGLNLKSFMEESEQVDQWMTKQIEHLETNYNRSDFSLEEGERWLRELDEIREVIQKYHGMLLSLSDRCAQISPLWQRGERISKNIVVTALCDYKNKDITIRAGDDCTLLDNYDLIHWKIRGVDGVESSVPSVVFRIPPPDPRLATYLSRLHAQFEKLRKLWEKKHRLVRYNMVLNTMKTVRGWDLDTFLSIPPEQRDEIIKALNEDANKLTSEIDPNDPMAHRLKDELRATNEHFYDLLNRAQKGPEPDYSNQFDEKMAELLKKLEEAWKKLNDRVGENVPQNLDDLERLIHEHKNFEDALQALDVDVSNVKELFRQLPNPTPTQRANLEHLNGRWEDLWDLSRMYVERLKALEAVLQGLEEVTDIVRRHEITLSSFDDLPAALDKLRGVHSQLIELNMVLQQQQEYVQTLNKNVAQLRQHVARTRFNVSSHPDVDRLEEAVQNITVRWDNVCSQVAERLKTAEETQQTQMIYRSQYDEEILWLDRVESTINSLRRPEDLRPEELQSQLDQLVAEYAQLQEHTATIENINKEGGKFIRDAKSYDIRLNQFHDNVITTHGPGIRSEFRRQIPQSKNGAQIVTEELEALNRRFAQLSSVILERKNIVNVLIQNWRRKQQEDEDRRRADEEKKRRAFEAARRKALDEADRLRRDREAAEAARRAADEADRLRRQQAEAEAARRAAEDAERRRREEEERRRREAEDAERRRREEEERNRRPKEPVVNVANTYQQADQQDDFDSFENLGEVPVVAKITEHEDEPQMFQEETVTKTQFYEMEGILHKQTGEILTFVEAIRQGLLDLSQGGEFFDIMSGSRVSLEKAAEMGLINQNISDILNGRHGIRHPDTGEEITLLEAIQIGLYDPDSRQLRDIKTGEILSLFDCVSRGICNTTTQHRLIKMGVLKLPPMALEQALKNGVLNPLTGEFRGKYVTEPIPLRDALANGYIQFSSQTPIIAVTLSDCIEDGLIDAYSGEFVDKNVQGEKFTLRDALERNKELIRDNIREVVNTDTNQRITLQEAILCHAINPRQGKFTDLQSRANLSLRQAFDQALISKPKTLTEIIDQGQLDTSNHFLDRGNRYTLVEAINAGVVDPEVRHIVDKNAQDVISIVEALERGVLSPAGKIVQEWGSDGREARSLDLYEAHRQGLLTKRVRHTIFDVKGIKNSQNNTNLSFNEAVEAGAFDIQSERVVDLQSKNTYLLSDAGSLVDPMLQEILLSPVGFVNEPDLSLVRAVGKGLVDASKGVLYDKRSQRELTASQAYQQGILSLKGALRLAALFDVHPLLMTPIKKRQQNKRIRRPGQSGAPLAEDQIKVTLSEAMKQGLIDSRTQRFRQGGQEMSLDDALSQGLIDPSSEWIVPSRASAVGPTIEEKTQETITETGQQLAPKIYPDKQLEESVNTVKRVKRTETSAVGGPGGVSVYRAITGGKGAIEVPAAGYHLLEAERKGILDLSAGVVSPPGTNKTLTVEEAFNLGILNPNCVTIRDPKSGRQLNAVEALEHKVMDKHGFVDNRGRRLTLQEAIDERVAHVEAEPLVPSHAGHKKVIQFSSAHGPVTSFRPVGQPVIEEHEQSWTFDSSVGHLVDASTGERISLDSAIQSGKLAPEDLRVRDALTGREMSLDEAQKWGIVNLRDGYYLDKTDNKRYSLQEAARQHKLYPTGGVPENAGDAVHTTVKIQTRSEISKKEAVPIGGSGALSIGDFNIGKLVDLKLYNASSGLFNHPSDSQAKQMTLKELIVKGFLNPYTTSILDKRQGKHLKLLDAIEQHLVDDIAGTVTDTQTGRVHDLQSAMREGLIKEDSLESYIHERGQPQYPSVGYPSNQGGHSPKLVERKLQLTPYAQEPSYHREEVTSTSSVRQRQPSPSGFVRSQVERVERSGPSGGTSGGFSNAMISHQPFGASHGDAEKMVDLGGGKNVMVKVIRGDDGLEKGEYVDPNTGMKFTIQLHGDPYVTQTSTKVKSTSQVQSIELEPHAQFVGIDQVKDLRNNRVMSLNDAQRLGLAKVDKKGKQTTKSYSAFRSNIELAVNKGVINSHGEKVSLEEAIRTHIIDIANLKYLHPRSGEPLDFSQAANQGLLDVTLAETLPNGVTHPATGEKISVKRAIDAGIINPRSGKVTHPFTNQRLSWVDLTKQIYNSITQNGIYDPKKGYAVPVTSALIDGLIDTHSQTYYNPITEERLTLEEAHHKGIIDGATYQAITKPFLHDYRTRRQLNLIQAVEAKLIDPRSRTVQLSADKVVPIAKAVEEGAIPREIGQQLRRVDKLTFAEAVGKGLIDVAQDSFTDPDSGKQMSIAEAAQQGLIDTGNVDLLEQSSGANLTKVLDSDQFDEKSGRVQNKDTRLHLPFGEAVHQRVIDPDSLLHDIDSSKTMTLREALNMGLIDNNGQYVEKKSGHRLTLNEAVKQGHLALIGSPMQAAQAVTEAVKRRDAEGYKFRIEPLQESAATRMSSSGPKFREETIVRRLTPQRAEPGLSVRVRSSVSDDPRRSAMSGGRASSLVDVDPLALVDRQHEFFESLRNKGVDLEDRVIENPSTMRNVSVREAVETGLLDVDSGEIIHPSSGRHYSLPKAIQMRLVNSHAGKKLMDAFNIASDELSTQLSPSHHFGSVGELHSTHTTSVSQPEPSNRQSWNRNISWENEKVTETETPWQGAPGEPPHNIAATYIPGHIPRENINRTTTQTLPDGSTHKSHYIVEHETSYD